MPYLDPDDVLGNPLGGGSPRKVQGVLRKDKPWVKCQNLNNRRHFAIIWAKSLTPGGDREFLGIGSASRSQNQDGSEHAPKMETAKTSLARPRRRGEICPVDGVICPMDHLQLFRRRVVDPVKGRHRACAAPLGFFLGPVYYLCHGGNLNFRQAEQPIPALTPKDEPAGNLSGGTPFSREASERGKYRSSRNCGISTTGLGGFVVFLPRK
jgi:hypothetical protein